MVRPALPTHDLALTARPASADTFAPYGRLLGLGEHAPLGRRGGVVTSLAEMRVGPRRLTHLQRYPEARRLVLPLGDLSLLVAVLGPGEPDPGPPTAFRIAPGYGVLIEAGIWHAGPVALSDGVACEILETRGPVDRLDQRPVSDLAGVEGLLLQLPEEPGVPGPAFHLEEPGAVHVEAGLEERVSVGLLLLDGLDVAAESSQLDEASRSAADGIRSLVGPGRTPGGTLGLASLRTLWRSWALPRSQKPPYELLIQAVLDGHRVPAPDSLRGAVALCSLRRQVATGVYDAGSLSTPLQLRVGRKGEALEDEGERAQDVAGVPVLCDERGPFAGPLGSTRRARAGPGVHRALVAVYLPPGTESAEIEAHLEEASRVIHEFCGGREIGRLAI